MVIYERKSICKIVDMSSSTTGTGRDLSFRRG